MADILTVFLRGEDYARPDEIDKAEAAMEQ